MSSSADTSPETRAATSAEPSGAATEPVFVLVKPDGVRRGLRSEVFRRFEAAGFRIEAERMLGPSPRLAAELYPEHVDKPFFPALAEFMASGPTCAVRLSGGTVAAARAVLGATDPALAAPGTVRGDLAAAGRPIRENVAHCSDTPEAAARDIARWLP